MSNFSNCSCLVSSFTNLIKKDSEGLGLGHWRLRKISCGLGFSDLWLPVHKSSTFHLAAPKVSAWHAAGFLPRSRHVTQRVGVTCVNWAIPYKPAGWVPILPDNVLLLDGEAPNRALRTSKAWLTSAMDPVIPLVYWTCPDWVSSGCFE